MGSVKRKIVWVWVGRFFFPSPLLSYWEQLVFIFLINPIAKNISVIIHERETETERKKRIHLRNFILFTEGPFQSDALLVPEGCLFDHIHNASRCWPFVRWNQTGATACQERNMQMRSFAMLLPCGISLFSGVEFVCCPKHFKGESDIRNFSSLLYTCPC